MSNARILIVEDEGIEALDLQQRLASLGYPKPDIVFSGEEAIAAARETVPDLVLMDIMLKGSLDGVAAAERLRASVDVPIIYVTAYADEETLSRASITAPYGYIVKPFRERELHIAIDMALYRHRMERRLKESEKWLAATLRSIGEAVIATDRTGAIVFMNAVAERLTGWTVEEIRHRRLGDVFRIDTVDARPGRGASYPRLVPKGGTVIPVEHVTSSIRDEDGTVTGEIVVFRDVTERERAEREIHKAYAELEDRVAVRTAALAQANRHLEAEVARRERAERWLSEKNLELKNSGLMRERFLRSLSRLLETALEPAGDAARRPVGGSSLADLLDFVRLEAGLVEVKTEPVDVAAVIRRVADSWRPEARAKGLRLETRLPETETVMETDGHLLGEILSKLTRSAIDITEMGRVHIELPEPARDGPPGALIKVVATGKLADTPRPGPLEALRQPESNPPPASAGPALDLHVSQRLARLIGATITAASYYVTGCTLVLTFEPKAPQPSRA